MKPHGHWHIHRKAGSESDHQGQSRASFPVFTGIHLQMDPRLLILSP